MSWGKEDLVLVGLSWDAAMRNREEHYSLVIVRANLF